MSVRRRKQSLPAWCQRSSIRGRREAPCREVQRMSRHHSLLLALAVAAAPVPAAVQSGDFGGLVDIGVGRRMYLECRGTGSPAVVIVAGGRASAADWTAAQPGKVSVFSAVSGFTRVCAYDRPGTPVGDAPSRSDPVAQPVTAADSVADLHALVAA